MKNIEQFSSQNKGQKDQLLDILMSTILGNSSDDLLKGIVKNACEKIIDEELTKHLGYNKGSEYASCIANSRNGYATKKIRTQVGDVDMDIARDRDGEFSNSLIPRHGRDLGGITSQIMSLLFFEVIFETRTSLIINNLDIIGPNCLQFSLYVIS